MKYKSLENAIRGVQLEESMTRDEISAMQRAKMLHKQGKKTDLKDFMMAMDTSLRNKVKKTLGEEGLFEQEDPNNPDTGGAAETEMGKRQLHFIKYAAGEIMDYVDQKGDMDEWFQNKLTTVHDMIRGLHSYIEGDKRLKGMVSEETVNLSGAALESECVLDDAELNEKAMSQAQQKAAGAALSAKRGEIKPSELVGASKDMYDSMTTKDLEDFASTKHKGLPKKVEEAVEYIFERDDTCPLITSAQLEAFEKIVDKLFKVYKIDFDFGKRHFKDRMSDERNKPCIDLKELAEMIKKLYMQVKKSGNTLSKFKDTEIVLKDIQSQLNMPVAIEYDRKNDEIDVVAKTIMRKKDFKTPNPVVRVSESTFISKFKKDLKEKKRSMKEVTVN